MPDLHPLIVVEGMDGAGKNTHSHQLVNWFREHLKLPAVYRDFPRYESLTGKAILGHLKHEWQAADLESQLLLARKSELDELVFQCLMTVNRFECVQELQEARKAGPVVCDRYWPSGYAYGSANGLPAPFLEAVHSLLPAPDVCLFLDISVEESWKRRPERRDRYEKQPEMLHRVRWSYLELFRRHDWVVIDAMGSPEEVQTRIQWRVTQGLEALAVQGSTTP